MHAPGPLKAWNSLCLWKSGTLAHGAGEEAQGALPPWLPDERGLPEEADQQMAPFHPPAVRHGSSPDSMIDRSCLSAFRLFCFGLIPSSILLVFSGLP